MQHAHPRRSYLALAFVAAAIGIASSAVTADLFILGLERLESDPAARHALMAVGLLMIATELVAFGVAAYLPAKGLRGLRMLLVLCGGLLLAFEGATIYMTQAALMQSSETTAMAATSRVAELRTGIDAQRAAAKALRDGGALQAASKHDWTRHLGGLDLRAALETERSIAPMATELAHLEATAKPTMSSIFGAQGMLAYAVARTVLVAIMGIFMFSAAGALVRAAREIGANEREIEPVPTTTTVLHLVPTIPAIPPMKKPLSISEIDLEIEPEIDMSEARYRRVRDAVRCGLMKPALLDVKASEKVGGNTATSILVRLEHEGVTSRYGRSWQLV